MSLSGGIPRFNEARIAELRAAGLSEESAVAMDAELGDKDHSTQTPREKCRLCQIADAETQAPVPIGTADARYPLVVCNNCLGDLFYMLWDLPWLRYQMTQYRRPAGMRNYTPDGRYFGP